MTSRDRMHESPGQAREEMTGDLVLHFYVAAGTEYRQQALDLRDAITDTLATVLGIRLLLTDDGTEVYLAAGTATARPAATGRSWLAARSKNMDQPTADPS